MRNLLLMTCFAAVMPIAGCNNTSFKSEPIKRAADVEVPPPPVDKVFKLQCEGDQGTAQLVKDVTGDARTKVRLEGEFCGITSEVTGGSLAVMFLVDHSGSMKENDPPEAGSCGRLKAAEALVNRLEALEAPGVEIKVGLLPFGDFALSGVLPIPLAQFKTELTTRRFCSIDGGATNYESAFYQAQKQLAAVDGPKAVYLISDGLPTRAGRDMADFLAPSPTAGTTRDYLIKVENEGVKAAQALRASDNSLTLNAVFLGAAKIEDPTLSSGTDPQQYLEQVTGSKDRVRLVNGADDLAAEIVSLDTPDVLTVDESSVKGVIEAAAFGQRAIKIATFDQHPSREGVWTFATEPFDLYGAEGREVDNVVTLTIKTSDGKEHKATANLTFAIEPTP